jgi:hypothetical protein
LKGDHVETEISNEAISEPLGRIRKAFAKAMEDMEDPGLVDQKNESDSGEEHFSRKVEDVEDALKFYTPIFQEKVLLAVLARLAEKKKAYELEIKRQEADDALLNAITEWSTEKVNKLISILKDLVL